MRYSLILFNFELLTTALSRLKCFRALYIPGACSLSMWIISFNTFAYMLSWAPLESKIWLLQTFFGYRYGTLICWLLYQASLERGSLRTLTYDPAYDKSIWTSAMEYIVHTPGMHNALSSLNLGFLGRALTGTINRTTRLCYSSGFISVKKPLIALSSWELIN